MKGLYNKDIIKIKNIELLFRITAQSDKKYDILTKIKSEETLIIKFFSNQIKFTKLNKIFR